VESTSRLSLGSAPQSSSQLSHFVGGRTPTGLIGSGLAGHVLVLTCSSDLTTAEALPSRRVVLHGVRSRRLLPGLRYYGLLGLPLRSARFRLRLIRAALPRRRQRRRGSRVPHFSLHACCSQYPAGINRTLRSSC